MTPLTVGVICPNALPLFDPADARPFGGMEVRAALFARGLAAHPGFRVRAFVDTDGQLLPRVIDRVEVRGLRFWPAPWVGDRVIRRALRSVDRMNHFPCVRIRHWHSGLLWELPLAAAFTPLSRIRRALGRNRYRLPAGVLDDPPAVCLGFGVSGVTAELVRQSRRKGVKGVLFLAHDSDLSDAYRPDSTELNSYGDSCGRCYDALMGADRIVAQTDAQKQLLAERFGRQAVVIRNPYAFHERTDTPVRERFVLWVGRSDPLKRPDLFAELARLCPGVQFVMVFNPLQSELHSRVLAALPANVRVIDRLPFAEMEALFTRAALLVNTSDAEGFPNTFLQAAAHGVPVASLRVDPDGLFSQHEAGVVAGGDVGRLAATVRELWGDPARRLALAERLRSQLEPRHGLDGRVHELAELLRETARHSIPPG